VKTPKLYVLDFGLCSYLTQRSNPENLESGAILETWIMGELLKSYWHNARQAPFFYYRDKDKKEIDLLILQDVTNYPLECKKSALPCMGDIRYFGVLANLKMPVGPSAVICLAQQSLPLGPAVRSVSVACL
jgi:predicted AAA+ superfamily ATPase